MHICKNKYGVSKEKPVCFHIVLCNIYFSDEILLQPTCCRQKRLLPIELNEYYRLNVYCRIKLNVYCRIKLNKFSRIKLNEYCMIKLNKFSRINLNEYCRIKLNKYIFLF